jgi:hypothetical protein
MTPHSDYIVFLYTKDGLERVEGPFPRWTPELRAQFEEHFPGRILEVTQRLHTLVFRSGEIPPCKTLVAA